MDTNLLQHWTDFDAKIRDNPYPLYRALRRDAPVHEVTLPDGRPCWIVSRYVDAREALLHPALFKDNARARALNPAASPVGVPGIFDRNVLSVDPPDHARLRGLISRAFTRSRVEGLRPRIQEIADGLLDRMAGQDPADLVAGNAYPLPITVICELLGVPEKDRDGLHPLFEALFGTGPRDGIDAELLKAATDLVAYFTALLAEKRAHPADDLLTALIDGSDGGERLDQAELLSTTFVLILAGHETTANLIANGAYGLLTHPDQLASVRADESLIPGAVDEFLRYDGPVQHATFRFTAEEIEIGGVTIPAYQPVLVLLAGANRDPEQFPHADTLDIRRESHQHLAFGHGIHYCVGAPLARLEGQIAFSTLLRRFPDLRLAVDPDDVHWRYDVVVRSLLSLPVHLAPVPAIPAPARSAVNRPVPVPQ